MRKIFAVTTSFFFIWGFVTVATSMLIPHFKEYFDLSYAKVMLVDFSFYIAYGLFSIPSGFVLAKLGYKRSMLLALFIASVGAFLFLPAIDQLGYGLFLLALFILSSGIVLLQVAANPFIANLKEDGLGSSRLNLAQGFNSLGTTFAPLFGSAFILSPFMSGMLGIEKIYTALGVLFFIAFLLVYFSTFPEQPKVFASRTINTITVYPHLILGVFAIFFYVGAEVGIGSFLSLYLKEKANLPIHIAAFFVSIYWAGAMIGRFIGFYFLKKIPAKEYLSLHILGAILLLGSVFLLPYKLGAFALLGIGFFNSIMFPTIFTLSILDLKEDTPKGSGLLCSAIIGGSFLPFLQGILADSFGMIFSFLLPFFGYLYLFFFARKGHAVRQKT